MNRYELNKNDFNLIDAALAYFAKDHVGQIAQHASEMRERFEKAHTGWLETEE